MAQRSRLALLAVSRLSLAVGPPPAKAPIFGERPMLRKQVKKPIGKVVLKTLLPASRPSEVTRTEDGPPLTGWDC